MNDVPAFPLRSHEHDNDTNGWRCAPGMTLRDYFAAKAMQAMQTALFTSPQLAKDALRAFGSADAAEAATARNAYEMADAMLKARAA